MSDFEWTKNRELAALSLARGTTVAAAEKLARLALSE